MSDEPNRSRTAWPGPMSTAGVEPGHEHELPTELIRRVEMLTRRSKSLTRVVVVLAVCLLTIGTALMLILTDRGNARDEQNADLQRQVRDSWCLALDTFPAGVPSLERLRAQYHCGPGIPFDQLTPDEQNRLRGESSSHTTDPEAPQPVAPTTGSFSGGAVGPPATSSQPPAPARPTLPN